MRRIALLRNPDSGSGEANDVSACLRERGFDVSEFSLDQIEEAFASDPDSVAVAGGDGSLACVAAPAARGGVPLAVIPTGTANDFARELGIPQDVAEACRVAADGAGHLDLDLAWMDGRPFLNVASLGLAPVAAENASGLKEHIGPLAYGVGALQAGLRADPVECRVLCDGGEVHSGEAWQVSVACTGAFGGGSSIETDLADGKLDLVVIDAGSRAKLVKHAYGLRRGGVGDQEGVEHIRCGEARIEFDGTESFNVDGELVESGSCSFRVDPRAVRVVVDGTKSEE